ncbi:MAG: hypothetical protein AMXMBFR33_17580 [Candidatus Xenobia bacterium]
MKTIFETCRLRKEIESGELPEDAFAARLADVEDGKAHEVYQKPEVFFQRTHPTDSLRELLRLALGRLSGKDASANPVLRLETSFGGGKTHSLIALYHAVSGAPAKVLKGFVDPELVPREKVHVATVVGTEMDPAAGHTKPDGVVCMTMWGEIAYRLGGKAAYEKVAEADRQGLAPGSRALEQIMPDGPCLIMIDEIARYLRVAREKVVGQGTLDGQVTAFLHSLFELAAAREKLVVVLTLASVDDAYSDETVELLNRLREMQAVLARVERTLRPVGQQDLAPVLRARLFEKVDAAAAPDIATAFQGWYKTLFERNEPIPEEFTRSSYQEAMVSSYPFHPHLLNVLENKLSTLSQFQRTRGALRLLALILRQLSKTKPKDAYLVMPYDLDLRVPEIAADVTSRLGLRLEPAIRADIVSDRAGDPAHAQAYDEPLVREGHPPVAVRVAQSIFLHSLSEGNAGCSRPELNLAVLVPNLDPHLVEKAANDLLDRAWHLHLDGLRLVFKDTPNLTKVIASEVQHVAVPEAKDKLNNRVRDVYQGGPFKLVPFPSSAADLPDDSERPKLAVLHYDSLRVQGDGEAPGLLKDMLATRGQGDFRRFANNVVFLVAHEADVPKILETARRFQAIRNLCQPERLSNLPKEQREQLESRRKGTEAELRVAVTACYRHLYFQSSSGLEHVTLMVQEAAEPKMEQQDVILAALREHGKVLAQDDRPLAASYVRSRVWPGQQDELDLETFQAEFASKRELPIVLDAKLLKATVLEGVEKKVWGYWDGSRVYLGEKVPEVQLRREHKLVTVERAEALRPPVPTPNGGGGKTGGGGKKSVASDGGGTGTVTVPDIVPPPPPLEYRAQGIPQGAFQQVQDELESHKRTRMESLKMSVREPQDISRLALALPRFSGFDARVSLELEAEVSESTTELRYEGPWSAYRALMKSSVESLIDAALKQKGSLQVGMTVQLDAREPVLVSEQQGGFQQARLALTELAVTFVSLEVRALEKES